MVMCLQGALAGRGGLRLDTWAFSSIPQVDKVSRGGVSKNTAPFFGVAMEELRPVCD